jgi:hypothetical protein
MLTPRRRQRSAGDDKDRKGDNGRKAGWEEYNSGRSDGENSFELYNNDGAEGGKRGGRTTMRTTLTRMMITTLGGAVDQLRGTGWQRQQPWQRIMC